MKNNRQVLHNPLLLAFLSLIWLNNFVRPDDFETTVEPRYFELG